MKLHFDPKQQFQHDAISAIVGIFKGQPFLKSGVSPTAKIEEKDGFYLVNKTEIALILDKMNKEIIKTVLDVNPQKVITLDRLFNNNDQLKTNATLLDERCRD